MYKSQNLLFKYNIFMIPFYFHFILYFIYSLIKEFCIRYDIVKMKMLKKEPYAL